MRIFISWSGEASREVALALREWLPNVIQTLDPFVSSKDIDKGEHWAQRLQDELREVGFGVVCLAADNLQSPWLHYEAGAIGKAVGARVCPVLFGISKSDVRPPMSQLQLTDLVQAEVEDLVLSINKAAGTAAMPDERVRAAVEQWWPKLESALASIALPEADDTSESAEPEQPKLSAEEYQREILASIQQLQLQLSQVPIPLPSAAAAAASVSPGSSGLWERQLTNLAKRNSWSMTPDSRQRSVALKATYEQVNATNFFAQIDELLVILRGLAGTMPDLTVTLNGVGLLPMEGPDFSPIQMIVQRIQNTPPF